MSFPLPVLGNVLTFKKTIAKLNEYSRLPAIEYLEENLGTKLNKLVIDFRFTDGVLILCDPAIVGEFYTTKNKYFDKYPKSKGLLYDSFGDSILFDRSTD